MANEKKEVESVEETKEVEVEVVDGKEKKENGFSKWWNKTKQDVKNSVLESNIENEWNKNHTTFKVYKYGGNFINNFEISGTLEGDKITYFGDDVIEEYSVIVDTTTNKAYYSRSVSATTVDATYDGKTYQRNGEIVVVSDDVIEVKVIKANDRYFIYKGSK